VPRNRLEAEADTSCIDGNEVGRVVAALGDPLDPKWRDGAEGRLEEVAQASDGLECDAFDFGGSRNVHVHTIHVTSRGDTGLTRSGTKEALRFYRPPAWPA